MSANLLATSARKSVTCDELVHIPVGYHYLKTGGFRLNPEHPPLSKLWAALPLLLLRPINPPLHFPGDGNFEATTLDYAPRFWEANKADFRRIVFWARVPMVVLTILLGVLIFAFARELFGPRTAVFAIALFSLEPTLLAHGRIVHSDVPATFGYLLFFYALHKYWSSRTRLGALCLGLACGLALLTKFSLLIIVPILLGVLLFGFIKASQGSHARGELILQSLIICAVTLLLINAVYVFQRPALHPSDQQWLVNWAPSHASRFITAIRVLSPVLPTYFTLGACAVITHNSSGQSASILGQYGTTGWWFYFPVAFALKTTIPFLLLTVASICWSVWRLIKRERKFAALLLPLAIFVAFAISSRINIGIRHFLPAFPFLFILAGAFLDWLLARKAWRVAFVIVLLWFGWIAFAAVRAFPNYTSYLNQLTAGHPSWEYLSDSNIEWGDDLGDLAQYLHARGETEVRGSMSGAWIALPLYGVKFWSIPGPADAAVPQTRYVAIGAGVLNGSTVGAEQREFFAKYRNRSPEAVFGGSIYLFRESE